MSFRDPNNDDPEDGDSMFYFKMFIMFLVWVFLVIYSSGKFWFM